MGLTQSDTARAIVLIQDGRSKYYVTRVLGVSRCSIQRAVKRFPETKGEGQEEKGLQLPGMFTFLL
jgi:hypothetical protein